MRSPIERMIDAAVRCTICGGGMGCDCWIALVCRKCKRRKFVERDQSDLPGTATVTCICPTCDTGDFAEVMYFDASGNQLGLDDRVSEGPKNV